MTRKESGFQSAMPRNLMPVPSATVRNLPRVGWDPTRPTPCKHEASGAMGLTCNQAPTKHQSGSNHCVHESKEFDPAPRKGLDLINSAVTPLTALPKSVQSRFHPPLN